MYLNRLGGFDEYTRRGGMTGFRVTVDCHRVNGKNISLWNRYSVIRSDDFYVELFLIFHWKQVKNPRRCSCSLKLLRGFRELVK